MSKNYLAYTFLTLAALFWSGNFIIGKFATLFEVPPLTLNFLRWVMVWFILIPFTIKEILAKKNYIKENFFAIGIMGILSISTFNSVVYFALNFTQVINAVLMLAAIPPMIIIFSSLMKIEKTNIFQLSGLFLSIFGVATIISNADIQKIISLSFNKGDIWMLVCVLSWSLYSTLLKKNKFHLSQFSLIQIMVTVGLIFLVDGCFNGGNYVNLGAKRLLNTQKFCKTKLHGQYKNEKQFWREFVDRLEVFDDKNHGLKSIINSTKVL